MTGLTPYSHGAGQMTVAAPQPVHSLGPVADDWEAINVWLAAVADNSRSGSNETLRTYRYHLAKLRWYCERELGRPPSTWTLQDVKAFRDYLAQLPASSLRTINIVPGAPDYSPFQKQPGVSTQSDIMRFTKAMFSALHRTGYLRLDPMALVQAPKQRRLDKKRAVGDDLFDLVLQVMAEAPRPTQKDHQIYLRDCFIFICLRESGLRASELIGAKMDAVGLLYNPNSGNTYWAMTVKAETAKGGKQRTVPVSVAFLEAFIAYRRAFGLDPMPGPSTQQYGLVLSVRTKKREIGSRIKSASDRRLFGEWRDVGSRQGLHGIIKGRIRDAVLLLEQAGDAASAAHLDRVSAHWLRHTFAMTALLSGQDLRSVATSLGHASVDTTMGYTEQDAIDLIESWERETPGRVARAGPADGIK
ncbi:tyrosine recombinase XerC [Janthinobacterium sp. HH103]|uniref:tyrosine-type recombinase/integrase n=1 Tax=unclassified Janthinobacterium TaxID=2610881 RepID=UPI000874C90D|nr:MULTISPECIES: tyrosine-type recombinase/integrase [unclassified Janthinobacterium]OEZ53966.1 tyrosine recombinase XerC [Janthinobacterium sp. HH100]OEZ69961.1 tyrosine recombinase XerC [Janthinobacterium sp. HH103]QOU76392.1 Tyrosine recombinase XerC [Janthinobacterium sp. HH102]